MRYNPGNQKPIFKKPFFGSKIVLRLLFDKRTFSFLENISKAVCDFVVFYCNPNLQNAYPNSGVLQCQLAVVPASMVKVRDKVAKETNNEIQEEKDVPT